jgi:hypothetical protein
MKLIKAPTLFDGRNENKDAFIGFEGEEIGVTERRISKALIKLSSLNSCTHSFPISSSSAI